MSDETEPTTARSPDDAVTWHVRVAAAWSWRLLVVGLAVYVLARIFDRIELVAFSFVLALFFTAVLHPLERALRRVPGSRSVSAGLALLIGILLLAGVGYFVVWQISRHSSELGDQISDLVDKIRNWLRTGPLHVKSKDLDTATDNLKKAVSDNKGAIVNGAVDTVTTVVELLGALLLILLSTFFLLRDGAAIWTWVLRLFPSGAQERMDRAGHVGWRTLGGYMRGQLLIALFHGVAVTIILLILQVPLAAALGVLIFLGSFIPIIGLTVAGALATAVALLEHGLTAGIVVAISITVLVQLEAHLLQPLIMSRSVEVHPLAIALAVLTGTTLYGIVGALLAVPFVAFINSTVHALRETPALPVEGSTFPVRHREEIGGDAVDMTVPLEHEDDTPNTPADGTHEPTDE